MLADERLTARPEDPSQDEDDEGSIVEVSEHGDEVRNEVDRENEIPGERSDKHFVANADTWLAHEPNEERRAMRQKRCESASFRFHLGLRHCRAK